MVRFGERARETLEAADDLGVSMTVALRYDNILVFLSDPFISTLIEHAPCPILWINE